MSGEIEAIGDLAQAGMLAKAVEQSAAPSAHGSPAHGGNCKNCAAPLAGEFCAACGQSAHLHRSMMAFAHDLLHGIWHFEGRIWRTVPLLAWRPGDLTRRYIHGERAKFVSPLALFLFAVFLLFAVAESTLGDPHFGTRAADPIANLAAQEARLQQQMQARTVALGVEALPADRRATLIQDQADAQRGLAAIRAARAALRRGVNQAGSYPWADHAPSILLGDAPASEPLVRQITTLIDRARENPDLLIYKIKSSAYKFAWVLIPLSMPFIWLAMLGRGMRQRYLYDIAVFATYSITFMLLLLAAVMLVTTWFPAAVWVIGIACLYAPFHLYRQVRHTWQLGRFSALVRTSFMLFSGIIVLVTFLTTLLAMGLFE